MRFSMRVLVVVSLFCVVVLSSSARATDRAAIPADFKITARWASPSAGYGWTTTITADGHVVQVWSSPEIYEKTGEFEKQKRFRLTKNEIKELFDKIKKTDLLNLPTELSRGGEDTQYHLLSISMNNKCYETSSHRPDPKDAQENRFYLVFAAILKKIPSPFPDQKAADYDPESKPEIKPTPVPPKKSLPRS
jgi:hypothetical protein